MIFEYIKKILVLVFAFVVFRTVYKYSGRKDLLSYLGTMLMITMIYIELLVIRDEIWVLEGFTRESLRWRDAFFPRGSIYKQRVRKLVVVVFAMIVFTWVYVRTKGPEIYAYVGIILMSTALYYEILSLRDEVRWIAQNLSSQKIEALSRNDAATLQTPEKTQPEASQETQVPESKKDEEPPLPETTDPK